MFHSQAPIVQKRGLVKAFPYINLSIRVNIGAQLEVFYQFIVMGCLIYALLVAHFPVESEGLGVEDLVSAPFSFSL